MFFDACGMARMPGFAPAGESLSLLTKKGTQRQNRKAILDSFSWPRRGEQLRCEQITPVSLRKPAKRGWKSIKLMM
jgi:hypothetical protein